MNILSLDTSGDRCSVCVYDGTPRTQYAFRHDRRLSERLPGAVEYVLNDAGLTLHDIDAFAVGLGPGSFTGVRVGVTMAKVWAMALQKPVVGVSSLDALAAFLPPMPEGVGIISAVPTRRTESVAAFYHAGSLVPVVPPAVYPNDAIVREARALLGVETVLIVGEIAPLLYAATPEPEGVTFWPSPVLASTIARLAAPRLTNGETDDVMTLVPLYVTPTPVG